MRCSVNRLLQLATKPRLQSMRSDTSSQVWPSASSKISRARRASSARSVRLLARRVSSISSEFDNVIASLMDAIIVYKWLLQSTRRQNMLASGKMVGFIPTKDYDKARAFYEGKLGFDYVSQDKFAVVMSVGGHMIRIVKVPNFTPLQGTILGWQVEDIQSAATWLRDRGVPPEKYPFVQDQNLGIWTTPDGSKVAWFKDPDGNILSISQHVS